MLRPSSVDAFVYLVRPPLFVVAELVWCDYDSFESYIGAAFFQSVVWRLPVVRPSFNCLCGVYKLRLSSTCCRGRCLRYSLCCWQLWPLSTGVRLPLPCCLVAETTPFLLCCCVFDSCILLSYCYMKWLWYSPITCCCYVTMALAFSSSTVKCHLLLCLVASSKVTWCKGFIDWISEWGFGHL
jgi:hypothetical protein